MFFKKVIIFFLILIFCTHLSGEIKGKKIIIGISSPFLLNDYPETVFIQKHFSSELIFNNEYEELEFNVIRLESYKNEADFLKFAKEEAINEIVDYLLTANVFSNKNYVFISVKLINPYNDLVVFSKLYSCKSDYTISEFLMEISKELIKLIIDLKLSPNYSLKSKDDQAAKEDDELKQKFPKLKFKHEIYIQNGFFKNHPKVITFLEFMIGYSFVPFNFFCIEGGIFIGTGYESTYISLDKITMDKVFIGTYGVLYFFLPGIVEPGVGLRFDFNYLVKDMVYFSFPIVFGLKFNIKEKNSIRISGSVQFISYDFLTFTWKNDYIIGFYIGYGRKI